MSVRIVVAAGGTGGHLFPALSLALHLSACGCRVTVLGQASPFLRREFTRNSISFRELAAPRFPVRTTGLPRFAFRFLLALALVSWYFCRCRPHGVVGMGGYASAPPAVVAVLLRFPLYLCEQNILPGRVNRLFSRASRVVFTSFPAGKANWRAGRVKYMGNPLRPFSPGIPKESARQRMGLLPDRFTVLVLGGSQGAHRLNLSVMEALEHLPASEVQFIHLTGLNDLKRVGARYREAGFLSFAAGFLAEMEQAYQVADLAVCRAGATTIAELAFFGLPVILVPYPYAAENHQALNAAYLAERGAAMVIAQADLNGGLLARRIKELMGRPRQLAALSRAAQELARPYAARDIAAYLLADIASLSSEKASARKR